MPSVRTLESQVLSNGDQAVPQIDADVVCFRHLLFGGLSITRHREVDELGRGGSDQGNAPTNEMMRGFVFLALAIRSLWVARPHNSLLTGSA
jgi:hypothetical protein